MVKASSSSRHILYVIICVLILGTLWYVYRRSRTTASFASHASLSHDASLASHQDHHSHDNASNPGTCQVHTCGATDPVSEPEYNMTEIIKQSLLLEEHLVEKNKHCIDCIVKHFMLLIALSEEAVCLAGSRVDSFPMMNSNAAFYKDLFERWRTDKTGERNQRKIEEDLRLRRKQLVEAYVLS